MQENDENNNLQRGYQSGGRLVPIPDPTILTTAQLTREIANARELIESKVAGAVDKLTIRADGQAKEIELTRGATERQIDIAAKEAQALLDEKLNSACKELDGKIASLKTRMDGNHTALIAALQAAKELVGVNNQFATKQIDAQAVGFKTSLDSLQLMINDIKERLTRIEGMDLGSRSRRDEQRGDRAGDLGHTHNLIALGAAALAALSIILTLMHPSVSPPLVSPPLLQRQSAPVLPALPKFSLRVAGFE